MSRGREDADHSPTGFSGRTHGQPWNARQKVESGENPLSDAKPAWAAVIGQWTFFVLGVFCVVCGVLGVFARRVEGPLSASVAWLGSAYVPTLRVTALLCVFVGLVLVRRGWSSHDRAQKGNKDERRP
ncbi:MAG TPA: hypothetical protein VGM11_00060 [Acidobacteriaceae bacterium]